MKSILTRSVVAAVLVCATLPALAQEVVINAVHFTPAQNSYAQSFLKFVNLVNTRGKGVIQIQVRGGPEVMPPLQLGEAQKNGLIDMVNAAPGLYLNIVPEGEVFSATSKKPWDLRANGGWDMVNKIFAQKANAHILAHVDGGTGFHHGFTGNAGALVLRQNGVQNGVRNLIGDFVRMAFGNRFGGEKVAAHSGLISFNADGRMNTG